MSASTAGSTTAELGRPGRELFIVGLTVVSLINFTITFLPVAAPTKQIAEIIDLPISAIFLIDFALRLLRSHPRRRYFITQLGWLDLLGSLPFTQLKVLRIFRLIRVVRLLRQYGARGILRDTLRHRADNALLIIVFLVIVLLEFGSMVVLFAESSNPNSNIRTGGEAVWWAFVSVTTVGYGDYTPITMLGRSFAVLILAAGVGLFGSLSGYLANFFIKPAPVDEPPATETGDPLQMLADLEASVSAQLESIRAAIHAASSGAASADR